MKVIDHYYLDQTSKIEERSGVLSRLIEETVNVLVEHGRTAREVAYVKTSSARCSWIAFCDLAREHTYHDGHGGEEINVTLMVVGKNGDWWLERHEYDGAEWWVYRRPPTSTLSLRPMMKNDLMSEDL